MKAHSKVLLLAEIFGVNVDPYIFNILQSIESSPQYKKLLENVEKARTYNVPYSETFLKTYDDMKLSKITTVKDALIAEATVNHLSFISEPRYFINPLLYNSNEMSSDLKYVDELPCFMKGREVSLEEMLKSDEITSKEKLKIVDKVCSTYRSNAKEVVIDKISDVTTKGDDMNKNAFIWTDVSICIVLNIYLAITLFASDSLFQVIRSEVRINLTNITYIVFIGLLFLYEAWTMINYFLINYAKNEKVYCYRYLKRNRRRAFKSLEEGVHKVHLSLINNIKDLENYKRTPLSKYNYLKNYRRIILYLELPSKVYSSKWKKPFFYVKISILTLLIISFILLLILTLIALGSGRLI